MQGIFVLLLSFWLRKRKSFKAILTCTIIPIRLYQPHISESRKIYTQGLLLMCLEARSVGNCSAQEGQQNYLGEDFSWERLSNRRKLCSVQPAMHFLLYSYHVLSSIYQPIVLTDFCKEQQEMFCLCLFLGLLLLRSRELKLQSKKLLPELDPLPFSQLTVQLRTFPEEKMRFVKWLLIDCNLLQKLIWYVPCLHWYLFCTLLSYLVCCLFSLPRSFQFQCFWSSKEIILGGKNSPASTKQEICSIRIIHTLKQVRLLDGMIAGKVATALHSRYV